MRHVLLLLFVSMLLVGTTSLAGTGTGLTGKYYNDDPADENRQFVNLILTRVDPQINFDWGSSTVPAPDVWTDHYSIRWSGQIQPNFTGTYTFYITSDDGTILRINETIVADNYAPHGTVTRQGTYEMVAGRKYGIRLDYFELTGGANCKLEWSCAQQPRQVVPQDCLYPDYFSAELAYPQMGWAPGVKKVIALAASAPINSPGYRINSSTGQVVMSGTMVSRGAYWGKNQYTADISSLTAEGVYTIFVDDYDSGTFEISHTAYTDIYYKGSHIGITDMVNSFWAFQRSNPAVYPDTGLPLVEVRALPGGGTEEVNIGVTGNVSGGWHDASSKDKSNIETAFSISNMCYALDWMTDPADRTALLNEMRWGTDYLLRVQNADGSFFSYMPDNPRRVYSNKSPGVAGECARALAAASVIYQPTDATYAQQCRNAAESAWTWIEANPDNFQRGLVSAGWCGYAGNVLGAAVELARATGTQKYKDYATTQIQNGTYTDQGGWISKTSTPFPGQSDGWFGMDNDAYTGKSVIALCRFYPIANTSTQTTIDGLCQQYVNVIKNRTNNPYSVWEKVFYSWFGFNQNLLSVGHCLIHIGVLFNNTEALDIGMRNFEWGAGFNPLGGSFAIGFGGDPIIPMFSRTPAQSIGGIMPGMRYIDNKLSTEYNRSWDIWTIGETGLGSSPVIDILAMLDQYVSNIALGKTATASSVQASNSAANAVDENVSTRWESQFSDPQWIQVDLADIYQVDGVQFEWEAAYGKAYQIQVSIDASNWSTVYSTTSGDGGIDDIYIPPIPARYVRMYGTQRGTPYGYSLWEFRIFGTRTGLTVTASSVQGSNTAAKAMDGNMSTRWESQFSDPQWIQVDMADTYQVGGVQLNWEAAYGKAYQIQVSDDASNWSTVYSTVSSDGGVDDISFSPVSARYIRMYGTQRGTPYGYSLWEFRIFGASQGGDTTPPAAPTGLTATAGNASVALNWNDNTEPDLASYKVKRATVSGGPYSTIATGLISSAYTDNTVTNGTTYYYVVSAVDASNNESANSSQVSATPQAPSAVTLLQDGFETDFNKWTDGGTTDWDRATSQKHAGSYSAHAGSADNDLISDNLNTTGYSSITIEFWYRDDDIDDSDDIYLQLYNGSSFANKFELGNSAEDTWHFYSTTITDAQYFRSNFRIKFEGTSIDSGENLWIDDVKVTVQ